MGARLQIASAVWFLTLVLSVPTAIAVFVIVLSMVDFGSSNHNPSGQFLAVFLGPTAVGAGVTKMLSGFAARESSGRIHAGPVTLGCAAGLGAGFLLAPEGWLLVGVVGPLTGAVAGSFIEQAMPPMLVGGIAGAGAVIITLLNM